MAFVKAERKRVKLKIALTGPSGSGKTYSALSLATGLGKKIALIDTENASASSYSDRFEFDTAIIDPPYSIQKYNQAIKDAEAAGYDVLIIDSITHAWAGEGGLLSKKEALDARGGNSYTNWGSITKEHEIFKARLLNSNLHLICTMRSKQDYLIEQNEKGKATPRKVGLAPIQREGMEYEFTTVFDVAMDHKAMVSKDRTGLFDGFIETLTKETGEKLIAWLHGAKEQTPAVIAPPVVNQQTDNDFEEPPTFDETEEIVLKPLPTHPKDRVITYGIMQGKTIEEALKTKRGIEVAKWAFHESNLGSKVHPDLVALASYADSQGMIGVVPPDIGS